VAGLFGEPPDYQTQGRTLDELKENLKDIYKDINDGLIPQVKTVEEMVIA
jgi:predicted RNase H-like HicB family nuclease